MSNESRLVLDFMRQMPLIRIILSFLPVFVSYSIVGYSFFRCQ